MRNKRLIKVSKPDRKSFHSFHWLCKVPSRNIFTITKLLNIKCRYKLFEENYIKPPPMKPSIEAVLVFVKYEKEVISQVKYICHKLAVKFDFAKCNCKVGVIRVTVSFMRISIDINCVLKIVPHETYTGAIHQWTIPEEGKSNEFVMLLCLDFKKVDSEKDQVHYRKRGSFGKQICCSYQLNRATAQQKI